MNELSLGDGKGKAPWCRDTAEGAVMTREELNVASMRGGGDRDYEIVHVGDHNALRNHRMQWRNIYHKEEGGNWRALGGTYGDR